MCFLLVCNKILIFNDSIPIHLLFSYLRSPLYLPHSAWFFLALEQEGTVGPTLRELVEAYLTDQAKFWHMRTFLQMAVRISTKTKGILMEHQVALTFYGLPLTNLAIHSAWIIQTWEAPLCTPIILVTYLTWSFILTTSLAFEVFTVGIRKFYI